MWTSGREGLCPCVSLAAVRSGRARRVSPCPVVAGEPPAGQHHGPLHDQPVPRGPGSAQRQGDRRPGPAPCHAVGPADRQVRARRAPAPHTRGQSQAWLTRPFPPQAGSGQGEDLRRESPGAPRPGSQHPGRSEFCPRVRLSGPLGPGLGLGFSRCRTRLLPSLRQGLLCSDRVRFPGCSGAGVVNREVSWLGRQPPPQSR